MSRLGLLLTGATLTACAIAAREAAGADRALELAGERSLPFHHLFVAEVAVLFPAAALVAVSVAALWGLAAGAWPRAWLAARHDAPPGQRGLGAGGAPLVIAGVFGWTVATAHAARALLSRGEPLAVGGRLALTSLLLLFVVSAGVFALLPTAARLVERKEPVDRGRLRVGLAVSTALALALVLGLFAYGITSGDTSGARGTLGIFAVLRRAELDLRPVLHVLVLFVGTWGIGAGLERVRRRLSSPESSGSRAHRWRVVSAVAAVLVLSGPALLAGSAKRLTTAPEVATALRLHTPLGGLSLALLQRASDRDGDGYSALFGGGDCNDGDPSINPAAADLPGNGIDEDCSGGDTPLTQPEEPAPARLTLHPDRPYNVLLITIDALRFDLGFTGHPRAISPSLDALAAKGTVFEHAYAMASMTWQSLGSALIGKYPSEIGGYERFNHFTPENVLVTERLQKAGVRTFAGMCQFAFSRTRPIDVPRDAFAHIGHGFDVWDISADPDPNGYNYEDEAVTSDKLTNAAIELMSKPENVTPPGGRFFAWFHYFDPHTQYVLHPEAPDFSTSDTSEVGRDRARYESELWFADHHIGRLIDFVARQPWGKDTAIIVSGDHGEAFNEHGMRWHRNELWEELIHVPLLVYVPGQTPNRVAARRSHIDLARTILELTGVPAPDDGSIRGESLLADALSPPGHVPKDRQIYAEIVPSEGPVRRALISGSGRGMKLVHRGGTAYELYDLDADPGEKKNLASRKARLGVEIERLQRFRGALKEVPWRGPAK